MKQTDYSLRQQLQIGDLELKDRMELFGFTPKDADTLVSVKSLIDDHIDGLVEEFYAHQTKNPDISLLIGDRGTLERLMNAQRAYILDLFRGIYDLEYVDNRLRIGMVHKRIGVEPKLYLAAVTSLKGMINRLIRSSYAEAQDALKVIQSLEKLISFDVSLVFDTYIRSLVSEIEIEKEKSDRYALSLEEKVRDRTHQLEELSRRDALTGLLNQRYLNETLVVTLRAAQRRQEPVSLVYLDIDHFKQINDTKGHHYGDDILKAVGRCITLVSRSEDHCFRQGGDEFCIILPNCDQYCAESLYQHRLTEELKKNLPDLRISIGIVQTGPEMYLDADTLLDIADQRMYECKEMNHRAADTNEEAADSATNDASAEESRKAQ